MRSCCIFIQLMNNIILTGFVLLRRIAYTVCVYVFVWVFVCVLVWVCVCLRVLVWGGGVGD
jgi:hypothetical protein